MYKQYNSYEKYNNQAVAIKYDKEKDPAPKIVAKGFGNMAEKIIELAKLNNIPIKQDKDLMKILSTLEIDSLIPLEAYSVVAEILLSLYKFNDKIKKQEE